MNPAREPISSTDDDDAFIFVGKEQVLTQKRKCNKVQKN